MLVTILITSLGALGEGIGSSHSGLKIFVEGALPGEEVIVEIICQKKNYAVGKLVHIIQHSPLRVPPPCPLFHKCGGCQLMHLSYEGQLQVKRQKVQDALQRIGGLSIDVPFCIASPLTLHYRNKIQLPIVWEKGTKKIGLFQKNSHDIIPIQECLIQTALGNELLTLLQTSLDHPSIRYILIRTTLTGHALIVLVTTGEKTGSLKQMAEELLPCHPALRGIVENRNPRNDNVILSSDFLLLAGVDTLTEDMHALSLRYSAYSFFQVNPLQAAELYSRAIMWAELTDEDRVIDAYCGVGALALLAANVTKHVTGIEFSAAAIADARYNGRFNQKPFCKFLCGPSEILLPKLLPADVVFINPPRKGCDPKLLSALGTKKPKKILYISCDPATLARDAKILGSYGFILQRVQPFDMFPQTAHVETLAQFVAD